MGAGYDAWMENTTLCWLDYETTGVQEVGDFPIEVGLIMTDIHLTRLESYQSLINWPAFQDYQTWPPVWEGAYPIHGIRIQELRQDGAPPDVVASQMLTIARRYKDTDDQRVVLISDNIQFEWRNTRQLMNQLQGAPWPYHYCGWDTSVLSLVPDINFQDPPHPQHRAMSDTIGMLTAVRKALGKEY
jgi:oligoribonuclease (3'-5' exoribonuclease)